MNLFNSFHKCEDLSITEAIKTFKNKNNLLILDLSLLKGSLLKRILNAD